MFFFTISLLAGLGGVSLIFSGLTLRQSHPNAMRGLVEAGAKSLAWAVGLWFGYRLFKFYAIGDLFSSRVVGCLKQIGVVAILIGILGCSVSAIKLAYLPHWAPSFVVAVFLLQLFLSILPGLAFFCVAWIMDEARKIQDEQQLTV